MRITIVAFSLLAGLFLAMVPQTRAEDEAGTVSKTGHLVVTTDDAGAVVSARLVCLEGTDDETSYALVLNEKAQALVVELKDKTVVVTGVLKKAEDDAESIVVATITEKKAEEPAKDDNANE